MAAHLQSGAFGVPFLQQNMLGGAEGDEEGGEDEPHEEQAFVVDDELE